MPEEPASGQQGHRGPAHDPDRTDETSHRGPQAHDAPDPLSIAASAMGEADGISTPYRSTGAAHAVDPLAILRDALGDDSAGDASKPAAAELPEELLTLAEAADEPVPLQPRRRGTFARRTPDAPAEQGWQEVFEPGPYAGAHAASSEPDPDDQPISEQPESAQPVVVEPEAAQPEAAQPESTEAAPVEATPVEPDRVEPAPEAVVGEAVPAEATSLPEDEAEPEASADQPSETTVPDGMPTEAAPRGPELTSDTGEVTGEWDVAELQATVWGPLTHIDEPTSRSSEVTPMSEPTANPPDDATSFENPADLLAGYTSASPAAQIEDEAAAEPTAESTPSTEAGSQSAVTGSTTDAESVPGGLWSAPDVDAPETEGGLWKGLRRRWHRSDTRSPRTSRATGEKADAGGDSIDAAAESTPEEPAVEALQEVEPQATTEPGPAEVPSEAAGDAVTAETAPGGDIEPGIEPEAGTGSQMESGIESDTGSDSGDEGDTAEYEWTAADLAAGGWSTDDLRGAGWTDEQLIAVGWDPEANGPATAAAEPALAEDAPAQPAEQAADEIAEPSATPTDEPGSSATPTAADGADAASPDDATDTEVDPSSAATDTTTDTDEPDDQSTVASEAGAGTGEEEDPEEEPEEDPEASAETSPGGEAVAPSGLDDGAQAETPGLPQEPDAQTATPESASSETQAGFPQESTSAPETTPADDTAAETEGEEEPTTGAGDAIPDHEVSAGMDQPTRRPEAQPTAPTRATAAASDFDFVFDDDPIELETYDIEAPLALRRPATPANRAPATAQVAPQATPHVAQPVSPPASPGNPAATAPAAETAARPAPRESTTHASTPADDEGGDDEPDRAAESRASAPDRPSEPSAAVPEDPTAPDGTDGTDGTDAPTTDTGTGTGTVPDRPAVDPVAGAAADATIETGDHQDDAEDTGDAEPGDGTGPDDTPDGGTPAAPDPTPPPVSGAPAAETPEDTAPEESASGGPVTTPAQQPTARAPWFHDEPAATPQPFWTWLLDDGPAAERISPSAPGPPRHRFPEDQALPEAAQAPTVAADDSPAPAYVEYRPSNTRRWILGGLFLAAAVLAVVAVFYAVQQGTSSSVITAVSVIVLACALWWGLISWAPRIITISNGTLEVAQGPNSEHFDLTSPRTEIELGEDPRARSWTAEVVRPNGSRLVIRSNQVRPQQFTELVNRYRPAGATPTPR